MKPLLIPNLGKMGLPRKVSPPKADLITVYATPYPVIRSYLRVCEKVGITPFGGGTMEAQLPGPGFITSGYRSEALEGNDSSPHRFGIALDIAVGDDGPCLSVGLIASKIFSRVGLYPGRGFIHVDLAPDNWIAHHRKKPYWVKTPDGYHSFDDFEQAAVFAAKQ